MRCLTLQKSLLITETVLLFEGGMDKFDTPDIKAKFEAAIVLAMTDSSDGLIGVQCKVSTVIATGSGQKPGHCYVASPQAGFKFPK